MKLQILLASTLILFQSCTNSNIEPDNKPNLRVLTANELQVSSSNETFAFNLYKQIHNNTDGNIFLSPISISTAVGMVLNGAEGDTKEGILKTINYAGLKPSDVNESYKDLSSLLGSMDKKVTLDLANSIWYEQALTINADFANTVKNDYSGVAQGLDFTLSTSKDVINLWVENNTNHKIKNLIEEIPTNAIMYLINATYFKGSWVSQFDKSKTKKDTFYKQDGSTTQVDMMTANKANLLAFFGDHLTMVDVPYGNGQFSMTILMPTGSNTLSKVVDNFSVDYFDNILSKGQELKLELQLPKFNMTWKSNLNEALSAMGMSVAFTDMASFPYLFTSQQQVTLTNVIHQATIEVNEEGAEAAAATAVEVGVTSVGPPEHVTINKPFFFIIREKHTKTILFMGELLNPDVL